MHALTAIVVLIAPNARAQAPSDCDQVRNVLKLARAAALEVSTLVVLEDRLCGSSLPSSLPASPTLPPRADCDNLTTMAWMGYVIELDLGVRAEIDRERDRSCAGLGTSPARWSTGQPAVHADGALSWPSGVLARRADDSWWWHTGAPARHPNGAWFYPNGSTAVNAQGVFMRPDGPSVGGDEGLAQWTCAVHPGVCDVLRPQFDALGGHSRTVVAIGMGWYAATH